MDALTYLLLGLGTGAINALLGCGLVLIYRGSGVINFAQGGLALAGAYLVIELNGARGWPIWPSIIVAVAGTGLIGMAIHFLIMNPLRKASPVARVIATLGILTVLTQVVVLRFGPGQQVVETAVPTDAVRWGAVTFGQQNLYLAGVAVVVGAVLALLSAHTRIGLALQAAAESPRSAASLGWSPSLLACLTWTVGGMLAAFAGAMVPATSTGLTSVSQINVLIFGALATALLAEFARFSVAVAAGLTIGALQSLATGFVDTVGVPESIPFIVIVVVLVIRGRGLPVRGTITDRFPRVGTGAVRPKVVVLLGLAALLLTWFVVPDHWYAALIVSTTFAIVGLSVVVLTGYTGQLSIAQFAFAGVGAFAAGRLAATQGWSVGLALLAGVVAAMLVGLLFGLPALRTRGVNLAVVTFGLGFAVYALIFNNNKLTGGDLQTQIHDPHFAGISVDPITAPANLATLCLVGLILAGLAVANVRRGRTGRQLLAVRTNERAAAAVGVDVFQAKLYAFTLSAAIAGLGGALYGFSFPTILYSQLFPSDMSMMVLSAAVIGGVGYIAGPIVGGVLAPNGLFSLVFGDSATDAGSSWAKYLPLIMGLGLLLTLVTSQNGLVDDVLARVRHLRSRHRAKATAASAEALSAAPTSRRQRVPARVLSAEGITRRFGSFTALSEVDISVRPGEVLGILGPNGAGKTTLVDILTGFTTPSSGRVRYDGSDITKWRAHRRARAGITRSFQALELFDDLTVRENLLVAADENGARHYLSDLVWPGKQPMNDAVLAAVDELGLVDALDLRPDELSYGRRRLVAIARAVASRPSILLLDEPAAGLDEEQRTEVGHLVRRLASDWGIGVLLIEHDVSMVLRTADRVQVLDFGKTIAEGTPEEIQQDPAVREAYLGAAPVAAVESDTVGA